MAQLQSRSLRTATYLLHFTPEEKAQLEQRCREVAAGLGRPVTLADALRGGARRYLDDLSRDVPRQAGSLLESLGRPR